MTMTYLKDRLAWLKSFFSRKPVITKEDQLINLETESSLPKVRRPGVAQYQLRSDQVFLLEGVTRNGDRVVYRLYHPETQKTIALKEDLFKLFFVLK